MTEKIMQDNLMYLTEWMRYNPAFQEDLKVEGNYLVYQNQDKVDISHFYLPEMLYNENFRNDVADPEEMNGHDLFQIIKMYCQVNEILTAEERERLNEVYIQNIEVMRDEKNTEFIVLIDNQNKKYRYDTKNPQKILDIYQTLKKQKDTISLKEFGSVIRNVGQ